ncbi:hypothetical protein C8Q76DRAFT_861613 [Earliella scabrosa]|nr:hypothetical protein C8Q76DRAFT_861613 [Earliella scabrosa]
MSCRCLPSFSFLTGVPHSDSKSPFAPPAPPATVGWLEKTTSSSSVTFRIHRGAVDPGAITTGSPPEVMKHVKTVLEDMGIEITVEREYEYRCIRPTRSETGLALAQGSGDMDALTLVGPDPSDGFSTSSGLSTHPQLPQLSVETLCQVSPFAVNVIYGNASEDAGDEVRFVVELTQVPHPSLDKTTYSLDVRRLKGNLRSYTFLIYTLRERVHLPP